MTRRSGNGLPSTVTPDRIKDVLEFANSQQREFEEALDECDHPDWRKSRESGHDFYSRIHGLLGTVAGRKAYENARSVFESAKRRRGGRADFFLRLAVDYAREVLSSDELEEFRSGGSSDVINRVLAESTSLERLDEFIWATGILKDLRGGGGEADNTDDVPKDYPVVKDVKAKSVSETEVKSEVSEVSQDVDYIRKCANDLDSEALDLAALKNIRDRADRLIASAEAQKDAHRKRQGSRLKDWRNQHSGALVDAGRLEAVLTKIEAPIDSGDIEDDELEAILVLCDRVLEIDDQDKGIRVPYQKAINENDFESVSALADALKSLEMERDKAYAKMETHFPEPPQAEAGDQSTRTGEKETPDVSRIKGIDENADPGAQDFSEEDESENVSRVRVSEGSETVDREETANDASVRPVAEQSRASRDSNEEDGRTAMSGEDLDTVTRRIEREIERGRLGLAYHLALSTPEALPSANAIKLVACNYLADEHALISADLSALVGELLSEMETLPNGMVDRGTLLNYAVLLTSAALKPSLTVHGGSFASLLSVSGVRLVETPSLQALAKDAADVATTSVHLPVEMLREDDSRTNWSQKMADLRGEARRWRDREAKSKIKFQAATMVWRRMLDSWENGDRISIGRLIELLVSGFDDRIDIDKVSAIMKYLRDDNDKEIDRIDRDLRGSALTKKIDGTARQNLHSKIREALRLAERYRTLLEIRPDKRTKFHEQQAVKLRNSVRKNAKSALKEIDDLGTPMAREARKLVTIYISIFENKATDSPPSTLSLSDLLHGDLFTNPDIRFDETGPVFVNNDVLQDIVNRDTLDYGRATIERARRKDFGGAWMTLDFAERSNRLDEGGLDETRTEVERLYGRFRQDLEGKIGAMSNRLDAAYARGILSREVFLELRDLLPADCSDFDEYGTYSEHLDYIQNEIVAAEKKERESLRRSLDELKSASPEERNRIEAAIEENQIRVAQDYIDRIESGGELPAPRSDTKRAFDRYFPKFVEKYVEYRSETSDALAHVRQALKDRTSAGPINAAKLSPDAAEAGLHLLDIWSDLRNNRVAGDRLRTLMRAVGFAEVRVRGRAERPDNRTMSFVLETHSVEERYISQLPDFGSRARGRYRLIVIRDYVTEEVIFREAGEKTAAGTSPNIVVFLNVLDANARRALARNFNSGRYPPTIVLDEVLVAFLAAQPGDRLREFFDCAAAFSFAQPFDPDATEVPPEMFFGRRTEREKILSMSGAGGITHLVYGGRRLGKTALLADIAREYRTNAPDMLISLINLKGTGIGEIRPADHLWEEFARELAARKIIAAITRRPESISNEIKQWLGKNPERRILLMVDEADAFFEADGRKNYQVLEQVKRLMDDCDRRFKVVFAGLHNVQRTARDPNTPFAHLGEPIRIGPMLPETDHDEIERLISGPVEALGYRFADVDSVIRIAAETNYYPALAQQFCKELLYDLRENNTIDGRHGPPYEIPVETVDRVFDSKETRDRICKLFSWTVQLDSRYEFLTYLIARRSFDNGSMKLRGLSITEIRQDALKEWPVGFQLDPSYATFEVLLEEMVGLGILRERTNKEEGGDKEYVIRTRNLRMLLGNDNEIERRFADAKRKSPPRTFDPAQFRNTLKSKMPSSLTADQERRLFSPQKTVVLVFGTRLGGLDQVRESLDWAAERGNPDVRLDDDSHARRRTVARSRQAGFDILLGDMRGAWDLDRIEEALDYVGRRDARKRTIRLMFLCGPGEAWAWVNQRRPSFKRGDVELQDIWLGPCGKEFAIKWLKEHDAPAYDDLANCDVDPLWPVVAGTAAGQERPASIKDAIDLSLDGKDMVSDVFVVPEVRTALQVFSKFPRDLMTADIVAELSRDLGQGIDPDDVLRVFDWGTRLGILHRVGQEYRLDSAYAKGLGIVFEG